MTNQSQIEMKKTFKTMAGVFLCVLTLYSCSSESDGIIVENALQQELDLLHNGVFEFETTSYVFKESGETRKFINGERTFDFQYENGLKFEIGGSTNRHEGEEIIVTNPVTNEFIRFYNFQLLKAGNYQFDAELSTGQKFYSLVYRIGNKPVAANKWHKDPPLTVDSPMVGALIELSTSSNSNCNAEVDRCIGAGAVPFVNFHKGDAWFSATTCTVVCR